MSQHDEISGESKSASNVTPQDKRNPVRKWMMILLLIIGGALTFFAFKTVSQLACAGGSHQAGLMQGIELASDAQKLVLENVAQGRPLNAGWQPIIPTACTKAIFIDESSGTILIVSNPSAVRGSVVLALSPKVRNGYFVKGQALIKKQERRREFTRYWFEKKNLKITTLSRAVSWKCAVISRGPLAESDLPIVCRSDLTLKD